MRRLLARQYIPLAATTLVALVLYVSAGLAFENFFSPQVFLNFFGDNAFLGIAAVGMTFVILSGGIDLSVGAVVGCASILIARLVMRGQLHPATAIALVLAVGTLFGAGQGALVAFFRLPPFLVTLGGMFLARGLGFVLSLEAISIKHPFYDSVYDLGVPLGDATLPATASLFLLVWLAGVFVQVCTRFGRNVLAIGGNEASALLLGLPVAGTKVGVYALSGFCSALAGVAYTCYTFSGNPTAGTMLELDAIAAVVIGGTLLSGGVGTVAGTLLGALISGMIQTAITFQGTLSSWWTKIAVGVLLLAFILLQKLVQWKL